MCAAQTKTARVLARKIHANAEVTNLQRANGAPHDDASIAPKLRLALTTVLRSRQDPI